jgi:hypothetical protein
MTTTTEFERARYSPEKRSNIVFDTILRIAPQSFIVKIHPHLVTKLEEADWPTRKITAARFQFKILEQFSNSPFVDPIHPVSARDIVKK